MNVPHVPKTVIDLEALLYALTQQTEPLPEPLQRSLQETGRSLQQGHLDAARQLRELLKQHPPLEATYQATLEDWDAHYASQERAKSLTATFQTTSGLDSLFVHEIVPTMDWIAMAKQVAHHPSTAHAMETRSTRFWDQADRVVVVIAGGVALGSAIAQLPGAMVGGVLAAGYGWYISVAKPKAARNS
jgi:hypothetical protein